MRTAAATVPAWRYIYKFWSGPKVFLFFTSRDDNVIDAGGQGYDMH